MILKKLQKLIKRHPFLYLTRFRLLSKNSDIDSIQQLSYNDLNPKDSIPSYFYEVNAAIFKDGRPSTDLDTIKQLSLWLKKNIKGGPGLSEPSAQALRTMLAGEGGVCSDVAQIFNNFCVLNDLQVREWGTTSTPFNKEFGGHSFNEVYCKELQQWVLIDVYWCVLFYDDLEKPLSVIELYQLKRAQQKVTYEFFNSEHEVNPANIDKNFLNPEIVPFLICDYRNAVYDAFLGRARPYLPVFVIHFAIFLLRRSYHYRFPLDDYKAIFSK